MSLILEALRRSEAERRRGQAPSLLDGLAPPRARQRPLWPVALAGLLGGVLLAAVAVWWLRPAPSASVSPAATAATSIANPAALVPSAAPSLPPSPPPPPPPPPTSTPAAPSTALRAPVADAPVAALPPPAPPAPAPANFEPAAVDPHLGPRADDLAIADLSAPLRASLPPLRLSMHVFADEPARRFAIVDGARLREGEALADGLQVLEIRRDGLRLAWQGRTLWLPR